MCYLFPATDQFPIKVKISLLQTQSTEQDIEVTVQNQYRLRNHWMQLTFPISWGVMQVMIVWTADSKYQSPD